jgi:hypothetical protein
MAERKKNRAPPAAAIAVTRGHPQPNATDIKTTAVTQHQSLKPT